MGHAEKSAYYQELKAAGVPLTKEYRHYTTDELAEAVTLLRSAPDYVPPAPAAPPQRPEPLPQYGTPAPDYGTPPQQGAPFPSEQDATPFNPQAMSAAWAAATASGPPPVAPPAEDAGLTMNTHADDEPIRTDENGLIWFKDEVRKPAYPKPRKRRIQKYIDSGSKTVTAKDGQFTETFEVAGDERRESEVRITLPSYQVGLYLDPRFPFKIHVYNDNRGFDLFDVAGFYGGRELVPAECKTKYVENVLCYDINSVVRTIEAEARQLQLLEMRGR